MIVLGIESSNSRGMGHLFRSLLYVRYLEKQQTEYLFLINDDEKSLRILEKENIRYLIVDYHDTTSNWEQKIIKEYRADVWLNDKFETSYEMGKHISDTGILFCMIDDVGEGEQFADVNFAGMIYPTKKDIKGKKVYCGAEYIVLDPQIEQYKRQRNGMKRIIVSMGGSDPFSVTYDVVKELMKYQYDADIVIGPNYKEKQKLLELNQGRFKIMQNVPSLIATFSAYDLAITGGGVTCCEANAAGLPCIIIANAPHEVNTGRFMEEMGGCIYAGSHEDWDRGLLEHLEAMDIAGMSANAMKKFHLDTVDRMMTIIEKEKEAYGKQVL